MEMKQLLIEQRDTGDKFLSVERNILRQHSILAGRDLGVAVRRQAEDALSLGQAERLRLGKRILELDGSLIVAALQPSR